jgi:hypothetical protein
MNHDGRRRNRDAVLLGDCVKERNLIATSSLRHARPSLSRDREGDAGGGKILEWDLIASPGRREGHLRRQSRAERIVFCVAVGNRGAKLGQNECRADL